MQADQVLRFDPFRLDPQNARLWRGKQVITLTPKAFAVLCHLVEHAGQLVTKDALLTAVWPEIYVSEGVLSECVREIRKALEDTPQASRFIQTAHRRGYRFIGKVVSSQQSVARRRKQRDGNWQLTTHLVGREAELGQLRKWLQSALGGTRQLIFVTGEAGIGKTTVVDAFVARLGAKSAVWIGRGQCIDHYGQGEAYLPVLEALGRMCREPEGKHLIDLLAQHAPTWLVQMPALLTPTDLEALQRRTQGTTRERMLRELAEALEVITAERPLVLWLEDLHWSDFSTLDLLAFVARRREPARLLIIGAYRPVEVIVSSHSLKSVKQELHLHGQCVELPLSFLTEEHVAKYLVRRFASPSPASAGKPVLSVVEGGQGRVLAWTALPKLAQLIHQRTEGNPLFMINLVDYLVTQGGLARIDGQWRPQGEVTAVESWAPESLQQMIEKQIERLSPQDRRVLEVASVVGAEFSAAAVAAGGATTIEEVEEQCGELARHEQFLRARGTADWPDGTVAARYEFLHALYQEVLYERVPTGRRVELHRRIGEREERAYEERAREIAAELALHFERGRDYSRAARYLWQAGGNASRRSAHTEAINLLTKGLELLKTLPDTPEHLRLELKLQNALGLVLMGGKGYAVPEVETAFTRARELCQQVDDPYLLFSIMWGLNGFYIMRGELRTSRALGAQLLALAQTTEEHVFLQMAHHQLGEALSYLGELTLARAHLEQGIALDGPGQGRSRAAKNGYEPRELCLAVAALVLWHLGYPDQALKRSDEACILAREAVYSFHPAHALDYATALRLLRGEWQTGQEQAEALVTFSIEQGLPIFVAAGTLKRGSALVAQGDPKEGMEQIRKGLAAYQATGSEVHRPAFLLLLAEAYGRAGQSEEGLSLLAEALAAVNETGARLYEVGLYRLKGELTLQSQVQSHKSKVEEAEDCFLKAIEIAKKQQARSLELRVTVSLARLWQQQSKKKQARKVLAAIYNWFTEGFDTKDLQEAKALLEELTQ